MFRLVLEIITSRCFKALLGRTGNLKIGRVVEHFLLFLAYTTLLTDLGVSKLLITKYFLLLV
jgi:choline-glycine betaine transporter